jgi:hypothetical protein
MRIGKRERTGPLVHVHAAHPIEASESHGPPDKRREAAPRHTDGRPASAGPAAASSGAPARLAYSGSALARAGVTVTEGWPAGIDPGQSAESFGFQLLADVTGGFQPPPAQGGHA